MNLIRLIFKLKFILVLYMEEKLRKKAYDRLQDIIKEGGACPKNKVMAHTKFGKEICRKAPKKGVNRKMNEWDEFRHDEAKMGKHTNAQLKNEYAKLKMKHDNEMDKLMQIHKIEEEQLGSALIGGIGIGGACPEGKKEIHKKKGKDYCRKANNPWIDFLHLHKGQGWSREQLREMYHKQVGGILSLLI